MTAAWISEVGTSNAPKKRHPLWVRIPSPLPISSMVLELASEMRAKQPRRKNEEYIQGDYWRVLRPHACNVGLFS